MQRALENVPVPPRRVYEQPPVRYVSVTTAASAKSKMVAFLLCLFLGYFGVHNFYVGKVGKGLLYFFTSGLFGIGWLWDMIQIARGKFTDKDGFPLRVS